MRVLNIGAGGDIAIPKHYENWDVTTLDIDASVKPDIVVDIRDMMSLEPHQFDAVYGSHVLEHVYPHEIQQVLAGIYRVLKDAGFIELRVPDCQAAITAAAINDGRLDTPLYTSPAGVVTVRDVLWGYAPFVYQFGEPQAHKNGFMPSTLATELSKAGFNDIYLGAQNWEILAYAFKQKPDDETKGALRIA